ncbi:uncharacterized protein LOC118448398 [Vespa mandarinia]|uniref:uncharacterized protein LOC118448398 n=1 Tax=Vespa mandarinia TaxID=7446 RepID=UPI001619A8E7|nr:uncharacterized protein LOC118448398 [Vespa mandarinia]
MRKVISWMEDHRLSLAAQKTEIELITRKRINTLRSFIVGDAAVQTKSAVKYLGDMLDNKLNYGERIMRAADKSAKVVASLGMHMGNVNGPRPCRKRLLLRAAEAVMLYGAEVWAEALRKQKYRKLIAAPRRGYSSTSKGVSWEWRGHQGSPGLSASRPGKIDGSRNVGTTRLISQLDNWINREAGEVHFYLTQFLTGHGLFRSYLARMSLRTRPWRHLAGQRRRENAAWAEGVEQGGLVRQVNLKQEDEGDGWPIEDPPTILLVPAT